MFICEGWVSLWVNRGLWGMDRYWKCQRWNGVFCLRLAISHGLQSLLETCVCYFWLMTVLGFRGPLDSESYMPTSVTLKVVDLIGCIRLCGCVCVYVCVSVHAWMCVCVHVSVHACSLSVCATLLLCVHSNIHVFLHLFVYLCVCVCVCALTFPWLKCRAWNSNIQFIAFSFYSLCTWPNCANLFSSHLLLFSLSVYRVPCTVHNIWTICSITVLQLQFALCRST